MRRLSCPAYLLLLASVSPACGGSQTDGDHAGSGGTGSAPTCPDILGDYDIKSIAGGCDTLNVNASQSINEGQAACIVEVVSDKPEPGAKGVNGGVELDKAGNFSDARLFLDDVLRYPCVGTWSAEDETMTIVCAGISGDCTIVLQRL